MTILNKRKMKHLSKLALLAAAFFTGLSANAQSINAFGGQSQTISSDQTCTSFSVLDGSTLTVNQGVTLTLSISNGNNFSFFDNSTMQLHGTLAGSVASGATWMDNTYINVYLSDGAKYTVTGLTCTDGDNYLRYYGYDAATDGNGTVSVKNGTTDVTSTSTGYKTTTYTFTATPASGYRFVNWTKGAGGEVLGTDASINVTCEQNGTYQVYANFEQDGPAEPQQYRLDSIPQGWAVAAGGEALGWTAYEGNASMGYVEVPAGAQVTVTTPAGAHVGSMAVRYGVQAPAPAGPTLDLATVTAATTVEDGYTVTGTLGANVKISIADGATVTLDGVTINGVSDYSYAWAGITCLGDATIILSGTNTVKGFYEDYPGIFVPENKTLTIQGDGSLTASSNGYGAGIGGGYEIACGNITIEGGTVNAQGGVYAAGIGGGYYGPCGTVSITGGTVTATGGNYAAGIGSGYQSSCGTVTITGGVTSVTATKGSNAPNSIGAGDDGTCGTVTIGGTVGAISDSPYTYTPGN